MKRRVPFGTRDAWLLGICLAVVLAGVGCQTNPYTGRSQLLMMPASQDMQLGLQAYQQVLADPKIKQSSDPRELAPARRGTRDRCSQAIKVCSHGASVCVGGHSDQRR